MSAGRRPVTAGAIHAERHLRRSNEAVIVLKSDGTAWTWGYDFNHGVQYLNTTNINNIYYGYGPEPYKVADQVAAVSLGNEHQFGILKTDGSVWSWGYNLWGGLGYDPVTLKMPDSYFYPAGFPEDCPKKFNSSVITIPYKFMDGGKSYRDGSSRRLCAEEERRTLVLGK